MTDGAPKFQTKPIKALGLRHTVASAGYSWSGFKRLLGETAFRQELIALFVLLVLFAGWGVPVESYGRQITLALVLFAVEALNTAIEVLVDRISPDYAEFAGHAKDLGSFAVFCLLAANLIHAVSALWAA